MLIALLLSISWTAEARVQEPSAVAAERIFVEFDGRLPSAWRERLRTEVARGFRHPDGPLADAEVSVHAAVSADERNYQVSMEVVDDRDGTVVAKSDESCQLCGLSEVGALVHTQATALRKVIEQQMLRPAILEFRSRPSGATVQLDGQTLGCTPLEHEVRAGSHRVSVSHEGHRSEVRTVDSVAGVRDTAFFDLDPLPVTAAPQNDRPDSARAVGWALAATGVASATVGAVFLALDAEPYRRRCSGADVDAFGNCRQRYNTLPHGVTLTVAGTGLLIGGAVVLVRARLKGSRGQPMTIHRRSPFVIRF